MKKTMKFKGGSAGVSLTGKPVKKAKPVSPAYLPSDKVKQGGGNPMSMSQGSAKQVANRERKPGMGDYSNTALYGKKSFAKTGVRKFEQGGEVGKNVKASKKAMIKPAVKPTSTGDSFRDLYNNQDANNNASKELRRRESSLYYSGYNMGPVQRSTKEMEQLRERASDYGKAADAREATNKNDKEYIKKTIAPKYKKGTMAIKVDDNLNVTEYNGAPVYKSANQKDAPPVEKKTIKAPPLPKTTKPFVIKRSEIKEYSKGTQSIINKIDTSNYDRKKDKNLGKKADVINKKHDAIAAGTKIIDSKSKNKIDTSELEKRRRTMKLKKEVQEIESKYSKKK